MSEMINNREYRQKVLKELITDLHKGQSVEDVKNRFEELIQGVSAREISEMEQALVQEGMPVEQIQNLCDVHAAVFKGSIEEIHREEKPEESPGHPVHTFKQENRALEALIQEEIYPQLEKLKADGSPENVRVLLEDIHRLWEIDKHYSRKENLLFPYMEKYEITAPPKVMWGVDDEIRVAIKESRKLLSAEPVKVEEVVEKVSQATNRVVEMIFKEENILFPMVLETLTVDEWLKIAEASSEIGYTLVQPQVEWKGEQKTTTESSKAPKTTGKDAIHFDAGFMTPEEINALLNTVPLDMTFVDKDDRVKYFTQGKERIFARPKTIIGREVSNCHPPASVHIVEKIVESFRTGEKDHEDFWIKMGPKYVYIRYFAVRNERGEYLGTLEVTQDIKPIQEITGEKRLLSE